MRHKLSNLDDMYDLSKPDECRKFLKELRVGNKDARITHFDLENGVRLNLDDMTDSQALQYGNEIYSQIVGQKKQ